MIKIRELRFSRDLKPRWATANAWMALILASSFLCAFGAFAQTPGESPNRDDGAGFPPGDFRPDFDGPPGFGPGGFGPGGPGGMMQETKVVKQFDKNGDGWLNTEERKIAREYLKQQDGNRGRRGPRGGFGRQGQSSETPQAGEKLSPADVKSFPDAPVYASNVVRTLFLQFEDADWEKELAEFKHTDVEIPAKLTVDGKTYPDVGVHFHGMSSFMMVGEGQKRSLVLSLDFLHQDQNLGGYRKLNLLNSHEDPSFLRTVLSLQIAREYMPAPKANFVRVVINGESWGIYINQQHFNKEFVKESFGTSKGARWKVPGSPNGHGGLTYLGDDPEAYKEIYQIKSKDDRKAWADLIKLCKLLEQTPTNDLEKTLGPVLDIDGVLKFMAWENVLANGDGFWTRASDYDLYEDEKGRFHVIPYDANETFSNGGGPGGPGGPGGRRGRGRIGPGMFLASQFLLQGDKNNDQKLTREELTNLADAWYSKLDPNKTGKLTEAQFMENLGEVLPSPPGRGVFGSSPPGGPTAGPGTGLPRNEFGPARIIGTGLFTAADVDKDGSLTRDELKQKFATWFEEWDSKRMGALDEEAISKSLDQALPRPQFGGPRGRSGGPGGGRGPGGPGGGGPKLDPLIAANDESKPLASKLLAIPSLRSRYLAYVHEMAERFLDWQKLGPIAGEYHALIGDQVKADTRKLDSFEAFQNSLNPSDAKATSGESDSIRSFAEQRRAYLLNHAEIKKLEGGRG